jgi:adenine-specific DNA-methyltransferase
MSKKESKIKTQGIRYTGSKKEILPSILDMIKDLDIKNTLDGFAGSTRVGQSLKIAGYNVDSNDISPYSKVFGSCYIVNNKPKEYFTEKVKYLNNLPGYEGWYTQNYGGVVTQNPKGNAVQSDGKKRPWRKHNTMRLDAIRDEIDRISEDEIEKSVLLTSLILGMDKVDNGLGHQVSYLKDWSPRSSSNLVLEVPDLITGNGIYNSYSSDIFNIDKKYDLLYLDPPYGTNNIKTKTTRVRYASYYHLWTTIVRNDKPDLFGASLRREDASSDTKPGAVSVFESTNYNVVKDSIYNLISNLNSRYFLFSYNNKSKVTIPDLIDIFSTDFNLVETRYFKHKENVQKKLTSNKEWMGDTGENLEYLFLIEKK